MQSVPLNILWENKKMRKMRKLPNTKHTAHTRVVCLRTARLHSVQTVTRTEVADAAITPDTAALSHTFPALGDECDCTQLLCTEILCCVDV